VEDGGRTLTRFIHAGTSYLGQEPAEAHFGLGADGGPVDAVTVHWPAGHVTRRAQVDVDQVLTLDDAGIFDDGFETGDTRLWSKTVP
ncbi:MAG: ASPIC/UnbV domain-containing protein, partial [Acidobacteriota bacterium]